MLSLAVLGQMTIWVPCFIGFLLVAANVFVIANLIFAAPSVAQKEANARDDSTRIPQETQDAHR